MALNAEEQKLFDIAIAALPDWFTASSRDREFLAGAAKEIGAAKVQAEYWLVTQARILTAEGPIGTLPDWLDQHARDRDTRRQDGESNAALRDRIRNVPESLTRSSLLAAVIDVVTAAGEPTAGIAMVELPRDQAFLGKQNPMTGTGGTFVGPVSTVMTFTPTVLPWPASPFSSVVSPNGRILKRKITFVGSLSAGNDGTFETTAMLANGAQYVNASGVAEVDATVAWEVDRFDVNDVIVTENRDDAYYGRGYRMGRKGRAGTIIVILPFGCTEGTRQGVLEMLRQKKGAGVIAIVECRVNP